MNKVLYILISLALVIGIGIVFLGGSKSTSDNPTIATQTAQNVETKDGIQYITINAKGGYTPKSSTAKAGVPTKLIVKTNGTYDCSASLVIRAIGYQKILSQTGDEVIDLGVPKAEQPIQGICGMGMYSFQVQFT